MLMGKKLTPGVSNAGKATLLTSNTVATASAGRLHNHFACFTSKHHCGCERYRATPVFMSVPCPFNTCKKM